LINLTPSDPISSDNRRSTECVFVMPMMPLAAPIPLLIYVSKHDVTHKDFNKT